MPRSDEDAPGGHDRAGAAPDESRGGMQRGRFVAALDRATDLVHVLRRLHEPAAFRGLGVRAEHGPVERLGLQPQGGQLPLLV